MPSLESRVHEALKQAGILEHSQRFSKAAEVVKKMSIQGKITPDQWTAAQEIAERWCR